MAFECIGTLSGLPPVTTRLIVKDTEAVVKGVFYAAVTASEADKAGAGNNSKWVGIANESDAAAVDSVTEIEFIMSPDAIYEVTDANARNVGDFVDINGTSDGVVVASNNDFIVVKKSSASEKTRVILRKARHFTGL